MGRSRTARLQGFCLAAEYLWKVRALCNLYTNPFPQSHAGEQHMVSLRKSLSLSIDGQLVKAFMSASGV